MSYFELNLFHFVYVVYTFFIEGVNKCPFIQTDCSLNCIRKQSPCTWPSLNNNCVVVTQLVDDFTEILMYFVHANNHRQGLINLGPCCIPDTGKLLLDHLVNLHFNLFQLVINLLTNDLRISWRLQRFESLQQVVDNLE